MCTICFAQSDDPYYSCGCAMKTLSVFVMMTKKNCLFVTYTITQSITSSEISAFYPSKCTHTWSSGQPTLRRPGSSWGFDALLKGLTSVVDSSWDSRFEPTTLGYKFDALSIRAKTAPIINFHARLTKLNKRPLCKSLIVPLNQIWHI